MGMAPGGECDGYPARKHSKIQKLHEENPDLLNLWKEYCKQKAILDSLIIKVTRLKDQSTISKYFWPLALQTAIENKDKQRKVVEKARDDYDFLKKMLW